MSSPSTVSPRPRVIEPDAIEPGFRNRPVVVLVVVLLCIRREGTPT